MALKKKLSMILALMILLLAAGTLAFAGAGSVVVDIVGSTTENTKVVASGPEKVELEIIGSTAKNTTISPPEEVVKKCKPCYRPFVDCEIKKDCKPVSGPWDKMHLGVDAWYGTFWYTDINMPKWPQI
jgi:hypothetical protein